MDMTLQADKTSVRPVQVLKMGTLSCGAAGLSLSRGLKQHSSSSSSLTFHVLLIILIDTNSIKNECYPLLSDSYCLSCIA